MARRCSAFPGTAHALPSPRGSIQNGLVLERFFGLQRAGSTVRTEITAGLTTFAAMAYILAVNPQILSTSGMDFGAVVTATALASAIMTAVFGLVTNWPIALAPGMGLNAFFAFTICGAMGVPWPAALAMVFCSGVCFLHSA
jgi:adenine/guanine/hypoxanthine permease